MPIFSPKDDSSSTESLDSAVRPKSRHNAPVFHRNSTLNWESTGRGDDDASQDRLMNGDPSQLRTIDLTATTHRPMYGSPFVNSNRSETGYNNFSQPRRHHTVLNDRDYAPHSGFTDNLYSNSSAVAAGASALSGATVRRRNSRSPGYDFRETAARRRNYQGV